MVFKITFSICTKNVDFSLLCSVPSYVLDVPSYDTILNKAINLWVLLPKPAHVVAL